MFDRYHSELLLKLLEINFGVTSYAEESLFEKMSEERQQKLKKFSKQIAIWDILFCPSINLQNFWHVCTL